jgi:hypothetical protein
MRAAQIVVMSILIVVLTSVIAYAAPASNKTAKPVPLPQNREALFRYCQVLVARTVGQRCPEAPVRGVVCVDSQRFLPQVDACVRNGGRF